MDTSILASQYINECECLGLSPSTISQYKWALQRLQAEHTDLPCDGFQLIPVVGDQCLKPESRRDLIKCLKTFFYWCERRYGWANPVNELGKLPKHKQIRRVLTEAEVSRLLSAVETPRDEALVLIILDCGLRLGEVAGMQRRDVMEDWVVVRGKVGDRRVPISSTLRTCLRSLKI